MLTLTSGVGAGVEALVAAHPADEKPEAQRLVEPAQDVGHVHVGLDLPEVDPGAQVAQRIWGDKNEYLSLIRRR